jgi:hypothetical protein
MSQLQMLVLDYVELSIDACLALGFSATLQKSVRRSFLLELEEDILHEAVRRFGVIVPCGLEREGLVDFLVSLDVT